MKISDVTEKDVEEYLRLDEASETELKEIKRNMESARAYILSYTGLSEDAADQIEELTQAYLILCADMFDNKNLYIEGKDSNINKSVVDILAMHSVNLL